MQARTLPDWIAGLTCPLSAMPKKKKEMSQAEQSERFKKAARDLKDAGELNPTEAGERFERAVQKIVPPADKPARDS